MKTFTFTNVQKNENMDGWTEVRYGRRCQRNRQHH